MPRPAVQRLRGAALLHAEQEQGDGRHRQDAARAPRGVKPRSRSTSMRRIFIRDQFCTRLAVICLLWVSVTSVRGADATTTTSPSASPPNVVMIISDDQGWG